jgi:pyridoxal 5'-phosphate synthase pdxT subunit
VRVGVLALQGAFREHLGMVRGLGHEAVEVRLPEHMEGCAALIIPGGESTAIGKLMGKYGFVKAIPAAHDAGMAVWGTCAGAILLASEILDAAPGQHPLGLIGVRVRRNAFGRQVDSFEAPLDIAGLGGGPFTGVFIRAPWIETVHDGVDVLARVGAHTVAARQGDVMVTSFHPELTTDPRVHEYFLNEVAGARHGVDRV